MSSFPSLRAGRKNPGDPFLTVSLFNFSSKCPVMNLKCFSTSYINIKTPVLHGTLSATKRHKEKETLSHCMSLERKTLIDKY